jgi:hypothetical protein
MVKRVTPDSATLRRRGEELYNASGPYLDALVAWCLRQQWDIDGIPCECWLTHAATSCSGDCTASPVRLQLDHVVPLVQRKANNRGVQVWRRALLSQVYEVADQGARADRWPVCIGPAPYGHDTIGLLFTHRP